MKRTSTEKPYLSWCLVVRNAEKTLRATLESLRERTPQAEIVIVDTMSTDATADVSREFADVWVEYKGPRGDWDREMPWVDDMASARQHSFEIASGTWRAWVDGDDRIVGPEEAEKLLRLNDQWKPKRLGQPVEAGPDAPVSLEDMLRLLEDKYPEATMVHAPYLYQRDKDGQALIWQVRERIVRWGAAKWKWMEEAHEVLVPVDTAPPRIEFSHLLYVHEKDFTKEAYEFSTNRHYDVLLKKYNANEKTARRCAYLANYAHILAPEREFEFLQAAYACASQSSVERYRALMDLGGYYSRCGLYMEARERLGGAHTLHPEIPDAWYAAGDIASKFGDLTYAVECYDRGIHCAINNSTSLVNPRHHVIRYPTILAIECKKLATRFFNQRQPDEGLALLTKAVETAHQVAVHPAIGVDAMEANSRWEKLRNELLSHKHAANLRDYFQYLIDNDEPLKACQLRELVAHNLQDHRVTIEMEEWARKIETHVSSPAAYREFYNDDQATGFVPTSDDWLTSSMDPSVLPRVDWIATWLTAMRPGAAVLDIGCCDGTVGIPLLQKCPGITYTGCDINGSAIDLLAANLDKFGIGPARARAYLIKLGDWLPAEVAATQYDAIIWSEIIEHVPDPVAELRRIGELLKPDGFLFITTPWGAFDAGHPPAKTQYGSPRDSRGHLRALTPRDIVAIVADSGHAPVDLYNSGSEAFIGDTMHVVVQPARPRKRRPVAFAVHGALWDWNGRSVRALGMGASEETIVYLSTALAASRQVDVFCPTSCPDVNEHVPYWPREHLRHLRKAPDTKVVISRGPSYAINIDEMTGIELPKVLWLQDTYYPDLTPDIVAKYETIVCVSEWHKQLMHDNHKVPLDKLAVAYNFLLAEHFNFPVWPKRKRDHFIYISSPDRGVVKLLTLWPRVLERYPNATLDMFYGWRGVEVLGTGKDEGWATRLISQRTEYEKLRHQKGVKERGMVNHQALALELQRASVLAYPTNFCLHGESRISVPGDHRGGPPTVAIKDLVGKTNFPVYAYDAEAHRFLISTALWVAQTRIASELVELELDDGQVVRCTPDHRVMNFDDEWVEAGDVQPGTRLRALHYRYNVAIKDGNGRWTNEHRLVGEWQAGRPLREDEHVDHMDPLRLDNRPEALQVLTARQHISKTHSGQIPNKRQRERLGQWTRQMAKDDQEYIRARTKKAAAAWAAKLKAMDPTLREELWAQRNAKKAVTMQRLMEDPQWAAAYRAKLVAGGRAAMAAMGSEGRAGRSLRAWQTRREKYGAAGRAVPRNHLVVAVRRIPGAPVFDMEVADVHSMVADGVVVHNCETGCLSVAKARAAGCVPVTTALAALNETAKCDQSFLIDPNAPDYDERWLDAVAMAAETSDAERDRMAKDAIEQYRLEAVLPIWEKILR